MSSLVPATFSKQKVDVLPRSCEHNRLALQSFGRQTLPDSSDRMQTWADLGNCPAVQTAQLSWRLTWHHWFALTAICALHFAKRHKETMCLQHMSSQSRILALLSLFMEYRDSLFTGTQVPKAKHSSRPAAKHAGGRGLLVKIHLQSEHCPSLPPVALWLNSSQNHQISQEFFSKIRGLTPTAVELLHSVYTKWLSLLWQAAWLMLPESLTLARQLKDPRLTSKVLCCHWQLSSGHGRVCGSLQRHRNCILHHTSSSSTYSDLWLKQLETIQSLPRLFGLLVFILVHLAVLTTSTNLLKKSESDPTPTVFSFFGVWILGCFRSSQQ